MFLIPTPLRNRAASLPLSQFNSAARQLIELDKPSDSSGDSGEGSSSGPQTNGAQRVGEKKNSKKRHSFTSLTMSHKPMLAPPPQRHSMEISGPVLISSSNPTAAARIGEISGGLSCSAPSQVRLSTGPQRMMGGAADAWRGAFLKSAASYVLLQRHAEGCGSEKEALFLYLLF